MRNYRATGEILTVTAPSGGVLSGNLVIVGSIIGVAQKDAAEGDPVAIVTTGVFEFSKVSAQAWTQGETAVYAAEQTDGTFLMTSSSGGNTLIGVAVEDAANPTDTGLVRLNGVFGLA